MCMPAAERSKRPPLVRAALAIALATALAGHAAAALYKWTDANGRVVYSDQPPPAGSNATAEVLRGPPPAANPQAVKEMAAKEVEFRKRQSDKAEDAKKADKARAEADKKNDYCAQLRYNARLLASDENVFRLDDKGERVFYEPEARQKELQRVESTLREANCPPAPPPAKAEGS